jgi:hypothetical protein
MILPAIIRTSMERDFYSEIDLFDPLELHNATPFTPEPYVPSKDIVELHDSPRFGHTNNIETFITGLADENAEMRDNYILGVTAGGYFLCHNEDMEMLLTSCYTVISPLVALYVRSNDCVRNRPSLVHDNSWS